MNWNVPPPFITTWSHYCFGISGRTGTTLAAASVAWPSASLAVYIPITIPWPYTVRRLFWVNGSSPGGTHSIGLYRSDGTGLFASAGVTGSGASSAQFVTPASPIQLAPGRYFLGYSINQTTSNRVLGNAMAAAIKRILGIYQQTSANPLPANATFSTAANTTIIFAGITNTT